jgi:hypothetical protein
MNAFSNKALLKKYGSWVQVQVKFYDFLFMTATQICPECFNNKSIEEIRDGMVDGETLYETSIKAIFNLFPTFEVAWQAFLKEEVST